MVFEKSPYHRHIKYILNFISNNFLIILNIQTISLGTLWNELDMIVLIFTGNLGYLQISESVDFTG